MSFKPNCKTKDNLFEVEIDKDNLSYEAIPRNWNITKVDMTTNKISAYNSNTKRLSEKTLYIGPKGLYFTSNTGKKYYIDDLDEIHGIKRAYERIADIMDNLWWEQGTYTHGYLDGLHDAIKIIEEECPEVKEAPHDPRDE